MGNVGTLWWSILKLFHHAPTKHGIYKAHGPIWVGYGQILEEVPQKQIASVQLTGKNWGYDRLHSSPWFNSYVHIPHRHTQIYHRPGERRTWHPWHPGRTWRTFLRSELGGQITWQAPSDPSRLQEGLFIGFVGYVYRHKVHPLPNHVPPTPKKRSGWLAKKTLVDLIKGSWWFFWGPAAIRPSSFWR